MQSTFGSEYFGNERLRLLQFQSYDASRGRSMLLQQLSASTRPYLLVCVHRSVRNAAISGIFRVAVIRRRGWTKRSVLIAELRSSLGSRAENR